MKKTTLALGSLLALGLVANTFAETTNVYSRNAVGYLNIGLNTAYTLMSVPMTKDASTSLSIGDLFPSPLSGTTLFIYDPNTLNYRSFMYSPDYGGIWYDMQSWEDGSTQRIDRGIGFWVAWPGDPTNISVVGEVPGVALSTTTITLPNGFVLMSYPYPTARAISTTKLGQDSQAGDEMFVWTGTNYKTYGKDASNWIDFDSWLIADPVLQPGQGFWYKNSGAQRAVNETKPYNWP